MDTTTNAMKIKWHVNRMGYTDLTLGFRTPCAMAGPRAPPWPGASAGTAHRTFPIYQAIRAVIP